MEMWGKQGPHCPSVPTDAPASAAELPLPLVLPPHPFSFPFMPASVGPSPPPYLHPWVSYNETGEDTPPNGKGESWGDRLGSNPIEVCKMNR